MDKKKYCESREEGSKKNKKTSKKSKKHKSKKKKRRHSSSSESGSEKSAWVEKNVDQKKSSLPPPELQQRDDWMSADNFFIPTFSKEKQPSKSTAKLTVYDPATSTRELNPYYKTGEGGMPVRRFQRPKDEDELNLYGRNVKKMQLHPSGWRKSKHEERKRSRSRSPENLSESWRNFRDDRNTIIERSRSKSKSRSPIEKQDRVMLPARLETSSEASVSHSDFLTDQQMNEIGAKMIKAEMMNNTALYDKLKGKLERAKIFKVSGKAPPKTEERELVVLSITNAAGTSRPVTKREEPHDRRTDIKKRTKRVDTHVAGERMQYYPDDGKFDIKQMVSYLKIFENFISEKFIFFLTVRGRTS